MWDIFLFTGLLLISSSLLGLLPFMAVLWFISRSKDETFSHLLGSQKFTVYLVWMVVGAFMTHLFGGDIFPTYFKMIDDYLITISNSSWTNKTCLKYNQPLGTGDWNLKNFFYTMDYHGIFHHCLIAVMWGWREFVKSMRLNTIEQELEVIRIWTEKKDQQFLEIQNQVNVLLQKVDKKQNDNINASGNDSRILRSSGEKLNNEFSDEISEEKLKADYERNHS